MASPSMGGMPELANRLAQLEIRVQKLEDGVTAGMSPSYPVNGQPVPAVAPEFDVQLAARLVPLLGKAMLVIAGAYLLRALTTSSLAPPGLVVMLALGYALFWLLRAARMAPSDRLAGGVYSATSVLTLSPMLWENNRALPGYASARRSRGPHRFCGTRTGLVVETATVRDCLAPGFGGSNYGSCPRCGNA